MKINDWLYAMITIAVGAVILGHLGIIQKKN